MELKASLDKPFEKEDKIAFIMLYNRQYGYEIKETPSSLEAWGYTDEELEQLERQRIDALTLTPADVERALYAAQGKDFDDLKALIAEHMPQIDLKALSIEFRAKDFYRGATMGPIRLFDAVGALLGYTPADMDYLFENKELPTSIQPSE